MIDRDAEAKWARVIANMRRTDSTKARRAGARERAAKALRSPIVRSAPSARQWASALPDKTAIDHRERVEDAASSYLIALMWSAPTNAGAWNPPPPRYALAGNPFVDVRSP